MLGALRNSLQFHVRIQECNYFLFPTCQVRVSIDFIRVASFLLLLLLLLPPVASDLNCELRISVGTAGPQPDA